MRRVAMFFPFQWRSPEMAADHPEDAGVAEDDEPDRVEAWRTEQLMQAGYPLRFAALLAAAPDIDLHRACELIGETGDARLAYKILA